MKFKRSSRLLMFISIVTLFAGSISCSKFYDKNLPLVTRSDNEIWIASNAFDPPTLEVAINHSVKWTNWDSYTHTISSDTTLFDSDILSARSTFTFTFTAKGTYKYHCKIHPGMSGTIIVK